MLALGGSNSASAFVVAIVLGVTATSMLVAVDVLVLVVGGGCAVVLASVRSADSYCSSDDGGG